MLIYALALAALGFAALIVALLMGSTTWAWICMVVAIVGVVLFVVDWIRHHKRTNRR